MPEESYSFAKTRVRLEEIVTQVRKKDTSLEKSLDLLEEGVRLANQCTELIDHADWEAAGAAESGAADSAADDAASTQDPAQTPRPDDADADAGGRSVHREAIEPSDGDERGEETLPS